MLFEHWRDEDGSHSFFNVDNESARRVLMPCAEKCCEIDAPTWEAAIRAYHKHQGWEPYVPVVERDPGECGLLTMTRMRG